MSSARSRARRKPLARLFLILVASFAAWHVLAQFLWIAPDSPVRKVIPGDLLSRYELPLFDQSWSVFAPDPIHASVVLRMRAQLTDSNGATSTTGWLDLTAAERPELTHKLVPSRASTVAGELAAYYYGAFWKLNDEQKKTLTETWSEGNWNGALLDELASEGSDSAEPIPGGFGPWNARLSAYVTQWARAKWGTDVSKVQFEVTSTEVAPFETRSDKAVNGATAKVTSGWRGLALREGTSDRNFRAYVAPLLENVEVTND